MTVAAAGHRVVLGGTHFVAPMRIGDDVLDYLESLTAMEPSHQANPARSPRKPAFFSLERDFCRRRLARQKGPEDDVSAESPEIGDHHTREMAAKTAFLLASYQLRVSEDWVVVDAV